MHALYYLVAVGVAGLAAYVFLSDDDNDGGEAGSGMPSSDGSGMPSSTMTRNPNPPMVRQPGAMSGPALAYQKLREAIRQAVPGSWGGSGCVPTIGNPLVAEDGTVVGEWTEQMVSLWAREHAAELRRIAAGEGSGGLLGSACSADTASVYLASYVDNRFAGKGGGI